MEAAYLHMMALRGSAHGAALDAQILHGLFALAAAAMTGTLAARLAARAWPSLRLPSTAAWVCASVVLGTPWVIVCGSLAYNEMALLLFLAAALWIALDCWQGSRKRGWAVLGLLCGAAAGAKLTALMLVAAPAVAVAVVVRIRDPFGEQWSARVSCCGLW